MYKVNSKKPHKFDFDLIVIGSGAGGGVAAHLAAAEGKKVGLVETNGLGGNCTIEGCISTKALLQSANALQEVQAANQFGIRASGVSYNYRSVQAWKNKVVASTGANDETKSFRTDGITVIKGHAHFLDQWTINVGLRRYSATKFLIATGSSPKIPKIAGLSDAGFITHKEAVYLLRPPRSLLIIGGGATAYECAQIFAAFGTKIHIIETKSHLLPGEDPEVGDSAEAALTSKGIYVHTAAKVMHVSGAPGRKIITFAQRGQQHRIATEEIMVAIGKQPNVDIGLENTKVSYNQSGINVNRFMQTGCKHIFAAGDVAGDNFSIHAAIQEGRVAVHNMFQRQKIAMDYHAVPRCFYGKPEIAVVGKNEHQLKLSGEPYQTAIAPIGILGKAITSNYTTGFVKIIASHGGVLLGASIVAPNASEMLQELTFAIQHRHHACAVSNTLHLFPTWSEAIRIAAGKIKCI